MQLDVSLSDQDCARIAEKVAIIVKSRKQLTREQRLVNAKEAAKILGISRSRLYHLLNEVPHIKVGSKKQSRLLFDPEELISYLSAR